MKEDSISKKLLVEEINQAAILLNRVMRGLSIGEIIRIIRIQLGMPQSILAKRSGLLQPNLSKIENGHRDVNIPTLRKILDALCCDLAIAPILRESIETIRRKQAKKITQKRIEYLKGTMNLEKQLPDERFFQELMKREEEELLKGPDAKLWDE